MAIIVVIFFEIIDIKHERAIRPESAGRARRKLVEVLTQFEAVMQACQRIHAGLVEKPQVQEFELGALRRQPFIQAADALGDDQPGCQLVRIQRLDEIIVAPGFIRIQKSEPFRRRMSRK